MSMRIDDLFKTAQNHFHKAHYKLAEPLLKQLMESGEKIKADVPYMLGTIAFDKGQLKLATKLFRESITIDPAFTEASVGLSIILNDLGKYDQARSVFEDAYTEMKKEQKSSPHKSPQVNPQANTKRTHTQLSLNQQIALKHFDLAELYSKNNSPKEALINFRLAHKTEPDNTKFKKAYTEFKTKNSPQKYIENIEQSLESEYKKDRHFDLVEAYSSSGKKRKARLELDKLQIRNGQSDDIAEWRKRLDNLEL